MSNLEGQVAVITGASSGIGRAVALDLHDAGMKLVLTGRREERLKELSARTGGSPFIAADIMDLELPARLLQRALDEFGQCDVVFNNAGIIHVGSIAQIDLETVTEMVRVNVDAAFRLTYVALRHFLSAGSGHLINTSSILGTKVRPTAGAYAGTKYAIEALSEALRIELAGTGIKISCIEPGLVTTELHRHWEVPPKKALNIQEPLQPEDIARCVRFLLQQPEHVRIPRMMVLPGEQLL